MGLGKSKNKADSIFKFINNLLIIVTISLPLQAEETNSSINQESDVYTSYEGQSEYAGAKETNYSAVNPMSGDVTRLEIDLELNGPIPVQVSRMYKSGVNFEKVSEYRGTHHMGNWDNHQGEIKYSTYNSVLCSVAGQCFDSNYVENQDKNNPRGIAPPTLEWNRPDGTIRKFYYDLYENPSVPYDVVYTLVGNKEILIPVDGPFQYESQEGDILTLSFPTEEKIEMEVITTTGEILTFEYALGVVGWSVEKPEFYPEFWDANLDASEAAFYYPIIQVLQLVEKKDLFGNKVTISHSAALQGTWEETDGEGLVLTNYFQKSRINFITDSYGRVLQHEYYDGIDKRLKRIYLKESEKPYEVEYYYTLKNTEKLVENEITEPTSVGGGYYVLTEVKKPGLYQNWKYEYWENSNGGENTNYYGTLLLKKVINLDFGINETYYYGFTDMYGGKTKDGVACHNQKQVVTKVVKDSYQEHDLEVTYFYGGNGITTVSYGTDEIRDVYYYHTQESDNNWKSGLLSKVFHYDYGFTEETTYTYEFRGDILSGISLYGLKPDNRYGTDCSFEDRNQTKDTGIKRIATYEKRIKSKASESISDYDHEIVFTDFDSSFGKNWETKIEKGNGITKYTKRDIWYNKANNLIDGQIKKQEICIEDSNHDCNTSSWSRIERTFLETGLLDKELTNTIQSKDVDYYQNSKRPYRVYDANRNYKQYQNYTFGEIPKIESISGSTLISDRSVSFEGLIESETTSLNQTVSYDYAENFVLESVSEPLKKDTEVKYEARKLNTSIVPSLYTEKRQGNIFTKTYFDGMGRKVFEFDQLGNGKLFTYSEIGRIEKVEDLIGAEATGSNGSYSPSYANLIRTTYFDERGRKTSVEESGETILTIEYDDVNNRITQIDGEGKQITLEMESYGHFGNKRLKKKIEGDGSGNRQISKSSKDSGFSIVKLFVKFKNYIVSLFSSKTESLATGTTATEYVYTNFGQIEKVLINGEFMRTYEYNPTTKRLEEVKRPESSSVKFQYDKVGNITSKETGNGKLTYSFDNKNLLTEIRDDVVIYYQFTYDTLGRKIQAKDIQSNITWAYQYDEANRLTQSLLVHASKGKKGQFLDRFAYIQYYTYNADGLVETQTYHDGTVVKYVYNNKNQLISVSDKEYGKTSFTPLIQDINYTNFGALEEVSFGNYYFPEMRYTYDSGLKTSSIQGIWNDGSKFLNLEYDYYRNNQIQSERDVLDPNLTNEYWYDSMNRLSVAEGSWGELEYSYDDFGNRLTEKVIDQNGITQRDIEYSYNSVNQLIESEDFKSGNTSLFSYDESGNNDYEEGDVSGEKKYQVRDFDKFGRIKDIDFGGGVKFNYVYDESGTRIRKTPSNGLSEWYIRDAAGNIIGEVYSNNEPSQRHYYLGKTRFLTKDLKNQNEKVYYNNVHGNVVGEVTYRPGDNANTVQEKRIISEPFGTVVDTEGESGVVTDFGLEGKELDEESGLHYFDARYYNSLTGRFLSLDPIDGKPGDSSQNYNGYSYSLNDPVNMCDPSGMSSTYNDHQTSGATIDWLFIARNTLVPALYVGGVVTVGLVIYNGYEIYQRMDRNVNFYEDLYYDLDMNYDSLKKQYGTFTKIVEDDHGLSRKDTPIDEVSNFDLELEINGISNGLIYFVGQERGRGNSDNSIQDDPYFQSLWRKGKFLEKYALQERGESYHLDVQSIWDSSNIIKPEKEPSFKERLENAEPIKGNY